MVSSSHVLNGLGGETVGKSCFSFSQTRRRVNIDMQVSSWILNEISTQLNDRKQLDLLFYKSLSNTDMK